MNTRVLIEVEERPQFLYTAEPVPGWPGTIMYVGRAGPFRQYYFHNPQDENGFGGSTFKLPLAGGGHAIVRGLWVSNGKYAHEKCGQPRTVECLVVSPNGYRHICEVVCEAVDLARSELHQSGEVENG